MYIYMHIYIYTCTYMYCIKEWKTHGFPGYFFYTWYDMRWDDMTWNDIIWYDMCLYIYMCICILIYIYDAHSNSRARKEQGCHTPQHGQHQPVYAAHACSTVYSFWALQEYQRVLFEGIGQCSALRITSWVMTLQCKPNLITLNVNQTLSHLFVLVYTHTIMYNL